MKCPRCKAAVTTEADAAGVIVCSGCGARLRTRLGPASATPPAKARTAKSGEPVAASATKPPAAKPPATKPPATKAPAIAQAPTVEPAVVEPPAAPEPAPSAPVAAAEVPAGLDTLFAEIRAVRVAQDEILALLRQRPAETAGVSAGEAAASAGPDDTVPPPPPLMRSRRRKGVLLIDDDPQSRATATQALEQADVPVRTAPDGNAGLAAIAEERPDVIVLELGIDGTMAGKDFVNMVKATMEWVDLPIVLYTRVPIESQKEARTIHGADDLVPKGAGAPELLVSRVIALFRKA